MLIKFFQPVSLVIVVRGTRNRKSLLLHNYFYVLRKNVTWRNNIVRQVRIQVARSPLEKKVSFPPQFLICMQIEWRFHSRRDSDWDIDKIS